MCKQLASNNGVLPFKYTKPYIVVVNQQWKSNVIYLKLAGLFTSFPASIFQHFKGLASLSGPTFCV